MKEYNMEVKVPVSEAKDFCQQLFSNRSKDKNKPAEQQNKQQTSSVLTAKPQGNRPSKRGPSTDTPYPLLEGVYRLTTNRKQLEL